MVHFHYLLSLFCNHSLRGAWYDTTGKLFCFLGFFKLKGMLHSMPTTCTEASFVTIISTEDYSIISLKRYSRLRVLYCTRCCKRVGTRVDCLKWKCKGRCFHMESLRCFTYISGKLVDLDPPKAAQPGRLVLF